MFSLLCTSRVDVDQVADPVERKSVVERIRSFGQTPMQLFSSAAHPVRELMPAVGHLFVFADRLQATDSVRFSTQISHIYVVDQPDKNSSQKGNGVDPLSYFEHCFPSLIEQGYPTLRTFAKPLQQWLLQEAGRNHSLPLMVHRTSFGIVIATEPGHYASFIESSSRYARLLSYGYADNSIRELIVDIGTTVAGASGSFETVSSLASDGSPAPDVGATSGAIPRALPLNRLMSFDILLSAHNAPVLALTEAFGHVVSGSADGNICVWHRTGSIFVPSDVTLNAPVQASVQAVKEHAPYSLRSTLRAHGTAVSALALSVEWRIIASGAAGGDLIIWDLNRLVCLSQIRISSTPIFKICINSHNGDIVASSSDTLFIADLNGQLLAVIDNHQRDLTPLICAVHDFTIESIRATMEKRDNASSDSDGPVTSADSAPLSQASRALKQACVDFLNFSGSHVAGPKGSAESQPPLMYHRDHTSAASVSEASSPLFSGLTIAQAVGFEMTHGIALVITGHDDGSVTVWQVMLKHHARKYSMYSTKQSIRASFEANAAAQKTPRVKRSEAAKWCFVPQVNAVNVQVTYF